MGAALHRGARASLYRGLCCCRAQAPDAQSSVVVAHGSSCSAACGIFPEQGSNPRALHWQADAQPLHHQGSPTITLHTKNQENFNLNVQSIEANTKMIETLELSDKDFQADIICTIQCTIMNMLEQLKKIGSFIKEIQCFSK